MEPELQVFPMLYYAMSVLEHQGHRRLCQNMCMEWAWEEETGTGKWKLEGGRRNRDTGCRQIEGRGLKPSL
ncbi:hypothetical protein NDU88_002491 [Pleurodeles waltl]|uniref:Uncharacterized protein n=1 Tax=Pleurodeles waltl TaxID=8319 RepID=A0AAV7M0Q7_PLEWA|nr:hypothetical protein NDU88_002491 [Pleurodeles waltl]